MIKVSQLQRGNNLLNYLNVAGWHYDSSITADYEINYSTSILFLSLKFHACKPEYIYKRINNLKSSKLRILMVLIDVPNYNPSLQELFNMIPMTIVLCKNHDECAKYLKGFDIATKRSLDVLRRKETSIDAFLEAFPRINSSNALKMKETYNSVQDLFKANEKDLGNVFGIGRSKAEGFLKYLKMPFTASKDSEGK